MILYLLAHFEVSNISLTDKFLFQNSVYHTRIYLDYEKSRKQM